MGHGEWGMGFFERGKGKREKGKKEEIFLQKAPCKVPPAKCPLQSAPCKVPPLPTPLLTKYIQSLKVIRKYYFWNILCFG
jgi:hypothetical protein